MKPTKQPRVPETVSLALRRADQAVVAVLVLAGLAAVAGYWLAAGGPGGLIEIERAAPRRADFLVDVNTAGWSELAQLPEIGETLARRIVESRNADGPFTHPRDLLRVRGIGPVTLERIEPFLAGLAANGEVAGR